MKLRNIGIAVIMAFASVYPLTAQSVLQASANSMPEGTWLEITSSNLNTSGTIGQCNTTGCSSELNRLPYSFDAAWDDNRHMIHYVGQDHGETPNVPAGCNGSTVPCDPTNNNVLKYITYTESTNSWAIVCGLAPSFEGRGCGFLSGHGGDHVAEDPITGVVFEKQFGGSSVAVPAIWRYPALSGSSPFSLTASAPATFDYMNGIQWWASGTLKNSDSGGTLFNYNCNSPNGAVYLYSLRRNLWFGDGTGFLAGFGGTSTYNCFATYSPVLNVVIMGGGNDNLTKLWKMDQNWNITPMTDSPVPLGIQHGFNVSVDPVTGMFLIMGKCNGTTIPCTSATNNVIYALDPTGTGTYTQQTGTRVPPTTLYNTADHPSQSMVSIPITNYGVVMYITCNDGSPCNMWLYKHSAGVPWSVRSTAAGVVRAFSFDTSADFPHCAGGTTGCADGSNFGILPVGGGTANYSLSGQDTTVKAEGASSLFFTIPATSNADAAGSWFTNFSTDLATQFGAGQEFYVQWRQRFSPEYLTNNWVSGGKISAFTWSGTAAAGSGSIPSVTPVNYGTGTCTAATFGVSRSGGVYSVTQTDPTNNFGSRCVVGDVLTIQGSQVGGTTPANNLTITLTGIYGAGGWKQVILGSGDTMSSIQSSCTTLELVTQDTNNLNYPQWYNSCTGSSSHGPFNGLNEVYGSSDYKMQNQRADPGCLYSQGTNPAVPPSTCFKYIPNEWLTFQVHLKIGLRGSLGVAGAAPMDEFVNSHIDAWIARDGAFSQQILNYGPFNLSADVGFDTKYGKVWLITYDTNRDDINRPVAQTWYDSLIISTNRILDPTPTGNPLSDNLAFTTQPSTVSTGSTFSPPVVVTANLAAGGTDTTFAGSIALTINGCGAALTGTTTRTAVAGVATFTALGAMTGATGCTITASATSTNPGTSNTFNVTGGGSPDTLAFSSQPTTVASGSAFSPTVTVTASLAGGGVDTAFAGSVTLNMNSCGAVSTGATTQTTSAGVATFSGLGAMNAATGCIYTATAAGLSAGTSNSFNVTGVVVTASGSGRSALRQR